MIRFGTDGIRGRAGTHPITVDTAVAVGRAASCLAEGGRVVVGRDPRPSSDALAHGVIAGICEQGGTALDAGVVPTAAIGVFLADGQADVGVMVTASHNVAADNGFKVFGEGGRKLTGEAVSSVEGWLLDPPTPTNFGAVHHADALKAWARRASSVMPALPSRPLVVDLANGAARVLAGWLKEVWPGELHLVGTRGLPNDGVGSEHLEHVGEAVVRVGAWAGLAVDGDGDRCRLVDETGAAVAGDAVTWLLARAMGVDGLAVTVMSNGALEQQLPGVEVTRTPVGDKHLALAMRSQGLALGAEESGHVLFADFPAGDGVIAGLRALVAVGDSAVSTAAAGFRPLPRRLGKVRVGSRPPLEGVAPLQQALTELEPTLGAGGRVFLRYSGTEPVLRILVEGTDGAAVDRAYAEVERVAQEAIA